MDFLAEIKETSDLRNVSGQLQEAALSRKSTLKAALIGSPSQAFMQDKGLFSTAEMPLEKLPADALGLLRALQNGDNEDLSAEKLLDVAAKVDESRRDFDFSQMVSVAAEHAAAGANLTPAPELLPVHTKESGGTGSANIGDAFMATRLAEPGSSTHLASPILGSPNADPDRSFIRETCESRDGDGLGFQDHILASEARTAAMIANALQKSSEAIARQMAVTLQEETRRLKEDFNAQLEAQKRASPDGTKICSESYRAQESASFSEVTRRGGEDGLSAEHDLSGVDATLNEGKSALQAHVGSKPTQLIDLINPAAKWWHRACDRCPYCCIGFVAGLR